MTAHAGIWGTDNLVTPSGRPVPAGVEFEVRDLTSGVLISLYTDLDRTGPAPNPGGAERRR